MVFIDFVRHAQGYHNLSDEGMSLPDPVLTPLGAQQCLALQARYAEAGRFDNLRLVVASPLRRTLQTALQSFAPVLDCGRAAVVAMPELQEYSAVPCDVGSDPAILQDEFGGEGRGYKLDLSRVQPGWNHKGEHSPYEPDVDKLCARARLARQLLRTMTAGMAADDRVAVVTHGAFLHFLTQDYSGVPPRRQCRSYVFADPTGADEDALLVEVADNWKACRASICELTEDEQAEHRAKFFGFLSLRVEADTRKGFMVQFETDYAAATEVKTEA